MRLLHTSDWHLGKITVREPRRQDHEVGFNALVSLAKEFSPDLILHTGDLFDGSRPSYDDMLRAIEMLQELSSCAQVVVLCGNHDSPALFRLFQQITGLDRRIRFVDAVNPQESGILEFHAPSDGSRILLGALPFVHANRFVKYFTSPETQMATYAERIKLVEGVIGQALEKRREPGRDVTLFAAHLYVGEAVKSGTERKLHISDEYATPAESIPTASYAAFGHIHKPQALPGTRVGWYAGSMIPIDYGEIGEQKGAVLVEASPGRAAQVRFVPLDSGRPLMTFKGTLEQLKQDASNYAGSLCKVTIQTETPTSQLPEAVASILTDATVIEINEDCSATRLKVLEPLAPDGEEPGYRELFREFISNFGALRARSDLVTAAFDTLLQSVETEEAPCFAGLDSTEVSNAAASS